MSEKNQEKILSDTISEVTSNHEDRIELKEGPAKHIPDVENRLLFDAPNHKRASQLCFGELKFMNTLAPVKPPCLSQCEETSYMHSRQKTDSPFVFKRPIRPQDIKNNYSEVTPPSDYSHSSFHSLGTT